MGHRASRPIVVDVANGQTVYVPLARERGHLTVQGSGAGAVAASWTNDNIARGPASSYDVNNEEHVAPASAVWTTLEANVVTTPVVGSSLQALGLRLVGSVGASRVVITQEA